MEQYDNLSPAVSAIGERAAAEAARCFEHIDRTAEHNTRRVMAAFYNERVSESHFHPTTGYGYGDRGRDTLDRVFAAVFGCEDALVRPHFINGTHAIACALYAVLRPGDTLLSAAGRPYDTLTDVILTSGGGSLADFGVGYDEMPLGDDFEAYLAGLGRRVSETKPRAVLVQRSRGYSLRRTLSAPEVGRMAETIHDAHAGAAVIVDNCYGEFCGTEEPSALGADLCCGSLIKNPGGGLAPTGGYIAGKKELVELSACRLSVPGIGREAGCNPAGYREYYQGLFLAPHTVAQALKTAVFCARAMELAGFRTSPAFNAPRHDLIQAVEFGAPGPLLAFCEGIQLGAPVDSFVKPEPWDMPGYASPVVMAAGAFVQGASIELSADAPMREPYTAFMQGGLTYESGKTGVLLALQRLYVGGFTN